MSTDATRAPDVRPTGRNGNFGNVAVIHKTRNARVPNMTLLVGANSLVMAQIKI